MRIFAITITMLLSFVIQAQNFSSIVVTEADNGKGLAQLLSEIERKHDVDFISNKEQLLRAYTVTGIRNEMYLSEFLRLYLEPLNLMTVRKDNVVFLVSQADFLKYGNRKNNFVVLKSAKNADRVFVKGKIKDNANETVVGAQIIIPELSVGGISDIDGNFEFSVKNGVYELRTSFVGFETISLIVGFSHLASDTQIDMDLSPKSIQLAGVTITAKKSDSNVKSTVTGVSAMNIETIKELPAFMGEVDVIRSLTTFPGVSTAGELSSGFNVRGGDIGQNLILQDDAIIFNPTHLFGFFSAFNPDIVSNAELYKGGGPANYGGRISSVLNVDLKNGDAGKYVVKGGVGLVSSRLTVEGPIQRNKSSFIIGGRLSYVNWLINALENKDLVNSRATFHDITGKVFFTLNSKNVISLSGYSSADSFKLNADSTLHWSTNNISVKWDHNFNEKLSSKLSLSNSHYQNTVVNTDEVDGFEYYNSINNARLNYFFDYTPFEKIESKIGVDVIQSEIEPGRLDATSLGLNTEPANINDHHSIEASAYIDTDISITEKFSVSAGLRYSNFWRYGKDEIYEYDENNLNGRYPTIIDTLTFGSGELMQYYYGLEPRFSLRYLMTPDFSIKASYYQTYQYLHLIYNTVSATPQDYWVASSPHLKPEKADQISVGLFKNFGQDKYEVSVEGFYKNLYNAIDYIEGADNTLNQSMEAGLIQGKGIAYGAEFLAKKNTGKFNGWIAYTYSRSLREFNSGLEYKTINDGKLYPSVYDQPHNLSMVLNLKLSPYATFTTNFSYSSGRPITVPISKVSYESYLSVLTYSDRNEYRIPDYHRLDISITIKDKPRQNKIINGEWVLGIYNLYGRKNAYSVFFNSKGTAFKMSILGTAFPSITYNFKL